MQIGDHFRNQPYAHHDQSSRLLSFIHVQSLRATVDTAPLRSGFPLSSPGTHALDNLFVLHHSCLMFPAPKFPTRIHSSSSAGST
jgi:hypothetical protein